MARRVLEAELRALEGIVQEPMGPMKSLEIVKEIKLHNTYGGVFSLQFNYTGTQLAVGYGAGGIQLYNSKCGTMIKELRSCRQGGFAIMCLRFHPKVPDILYAASAQGHIYVMNTTTGELLDQIEELDNEINTMDFCVDGFNFATGGKDLGIRVYATKSNKLVRTYEGFSQKTVVVDKQKVGNTMRIFCLKFHPNNQYIFVSGGWDNHIKIWDIRDNEGIKRNIRGPHVCGDAIDMKEHTILTGQWTALHALQEYDYTTGNVVRELKFPNKDGAFLYAAQYCNDNTVIAGGSGTGSAEIIEVSTQRHIGGHQLGGAVQAIDAAQGGRVIAIGGITPHFVILEAKD